MSDMKLSDLIMTMDGNERHIRYGTLGEWADKARALEKKADWYDANVNVKEQEYSPAFKAEIEQVEAIYNRSDK